MAGRYVEARLGKPSPRDEESPATSPVSLLRESASAGASLFSPMTASGPTVVQHHLVRSASGSSKARGRSRGQRKGAQPQSSTGDKGSATPADGPRPVPKPQLVQRPLTWAADPPPPPVVLATTWTPLASPVQYNRRAKPRVPQPGPLARRRKNGKR